MKSNIITSLFTLFLVLFVAACGGGSEGGTEASGAAEFSIQPVGNEMRYQQTSITVQAGQEVTLTLENTATSPAMVHNIVVLNSNDDAVVNRVGQASLEAGEANGYIPDDPAIIAYTPLAQPGETVTVTFTAPSQPGDYRYICTFPGHYVMMQGTLTVT